jgi:hypothetical protein
VVRTAGGTYVASRRLRPPGTARRSCAPPFRCPLARNRSESAPDRSHTALGWSLFALDVSPERLTVACLRDQQAEHHRAPESLAHGRVLRRQERRHPVPQLIGPDVSLERCRSSAAQPRRRVVARREPFEAALAAPGARPPRATAISSTITSACVDTRPLLMSRFARLAARARSAESGSSPRARAACVGSPACGRFVGGRASNKHRTTSRKETPTSYPPGRAAVKDGPARFCGFTGDYAAMLREIATAHRPRGLSYPAPSRSVMPGAATAGTRGVGALRHPSGPRGRGTSPTQRRRPMRQQAVAESPPGAPCTT